VDLKTFILGSVPAALAILTEYKNPISSDVVRTQSFDNSEQFVPIAITGNQRDSQKNAIAEVMTGVAMGATEASGLVPTWISFTAALTAVFIDIIDPLLCLIIVTISTAVTAILGFSFFARLNFYTFSKDASRQSICRGRTGAECASRIVMILNAIIIFILLGIWLLTDPSPKIAALRHSLAYYI
jgi:hypothetical protein